MYKLIHHLRQKPDHHKRMIVLVTSSVITLIIFAVWLMLIKSEFAAVDNAPSLSSNDSPLVFIKESVANAYHGIMSDLKK